MAQVSLNTIKNWFVTGLKPIQENYHDWLDSYWHKDENIPITKIGGLEAVLADLATYQQLQNLAANIAPINMGVAGGIPAVIDIGQEKLFEILVVDCAAFACDIEIEIAGIIEFTFNQDTQFGTYRLDFYMATSPDVTIRCSNSAIIKLYKK
jgi:hypothetical protein